MKKYNFITKRLLIKEYFKKRNTITKIAKELKCSYTTIRKKLIKYKIERRKTGGMYIDGRTSKRYYCKDCGIKISVFSGVYGNKRCKSCCQLKGLNCRYGRKMNIKERQYLSKKFSGRNNPMFGKLTHSKKSLYKGIWMRSSWEEKYAKYLDEKGIKWEYEPKTFDLGNTTYTPDFYIPEFNCYIEIKGYWRDKSKSRFQLFKEYYPELRIFLMQRNDLTKLKVLQ